jgi:hypothetical protein
VEEVNEIDGAWARFLDDTRGGQRQANSAAAALNAEQVRREVKGKKKEQ